MNVRDSVAAAARRIGGDDARFDAELLLAHGLGKSRAWLYAWPEHELVASTRDAFEQLVDARTRGEPIAYLTGRREFWSLDIAVTADVLIPRHETELLVELALNLIPDDRALRVADLGTGSGVIALAIAKERPQAMVVASDASAAALQVARGNARRLGLDRIEFALGDWFAPFAGRSFDMIVSNPPYIAVGDAHLTRGDLRYEPASALVSGADGLDAIRRIVHEASPHLEPGGWLLIEHGWDQGTRVRALFDARGFVDVQSVRDAGGRERVTLGCRRV
jgi:release factor glutamine methyltransferase